MIKTTEKLRREDIYLEIKDHLLHKYNTKNYTDKEVSEMMLKDLGRCIDYRLFTSDIIYSLLQLIGYKVNNTIDKLKDKDIKKVIIRSTYDNKTYPLSMQLLEFEQKRFMKNIENALINASTYHNKERLMPIYNQAKLYFEIEDRLSNEKEKTPEEILNMVG